MAMVFFKDKTFKTMSCEDLQRQIRANKEKIKTWIFIK